MSYSRTARTRRRGRRDACPVARRESSTSDASSRRGSRGASAPSASRFARARGSSSSRSGRSRSRISPRFVPAFVVSTRHERPSLAAVRLRLLAPEREERPDDAVLASRSDPPRRAARDDAVEDRLDLVRGRVAGGAQSGAGRQRRSGARAAPPLSRRGGADDSASRACCAVGGVGVRLGAAEPVVDMDGVDGVAERPEDVPEARRVRAPGDEAGHLASGLDQVVARMCASTRSSTSIAKCASRRSSTPRQRVGEARRGGPDAQGSRPRARPRRASSRAASRGARARSAPPESSRRTRRGRSGREGVGDGEDDSSGRPSSAVERPGDSARPHRRGSRPRPGTAHRARSTRPTRGSPRARRPRTSRSRSRRARRRRAASTSRPSSASSSVSCVREEPRRDPEADWLVRERLAQGERLLDTEVGEALAGWSRADPVGGVGAGVRMAREEQASSEQHTPVGEHVPHPDRLVEPDRGCVLGTDEEAHRRTASSSSRIRSRAPATRCPSARRRVDPDLLQLHRSGVQADASALNRITPSSSQTHERPSSICARVRQRKPFGSRRSGSTPSSSSCAPRTRGRAASRSTASRARSPVHPARAASWRRRRAGRGGPRVAGRACAAPCPRAP